MCQNMPPCMYAFPSEAEVSRIPDASVSQQITRLLGTDDWAILHSGHEMVTDVELDEIESRDAAPVKRSRLVLNIDARDRVDRRNRKQGAVMAPWHLWCAWHPVRTRHHGWMWFRTVWRRQRWTPQISGHGPDPYWEYYAVTEEFDE